MNNKKARQIRKLISCPPLGVRSYKHHGSTIVCDDQRRVYQLAKKIYRRFKILPKITETESEDGK